MWHSQYTKTNTKLLRKNKSEWKHTRFHPLQNLLFDLLWWNFWTRWIWNEYENMWALHTRDDGDKYVYMYISFFCQPKKGTNHGLVKTVSKCVVSCVGRHNNIRRKMKMNVKYWGYFCVVYSIYECVCVECWVMCVYGYKCINSIKLQGCSV